MVYNELNETDENERKSTHNLESSSKTSRGTESEPPMPAGMISCPLASEYSVYGETVPKNRNALADLEHQVAALLAFMRANLVFDGSL
jgi:hypothetical protein